MAEPIDVAAFVMNTDGVKQGADDVKNAMQQVQQHVQRASDAIEESAKGLSKYTEGLHQLIEGAKAYVAYDAFERVFDRIKDATIEAEQAQLKLAAVYQTTGGQMGRSLSDLMEMSERMSRTTMFSPEQVQEAEAVLLTFSKVRGDGFEKTMQAAAGLASLMGTDLAGAARALGRAMDDPIRGLLMLQHYGVGLTIAQREHIRVLVELGQQEEAQRQLLDMLYGKYGQVAQQINTGLAGAISNARTQWSEFLSEIGKSDAFKFLVTNQIIGLGRIAAELKDDVRMVRGDELTPTEHDARVAAYNTQIADLRSRLAAMQSAPGHPTLFGMGVMPGDTGVLQAQIDVLERLRDAEVAHVVAEREALGVERDRKQQTADLNAQLQLLAEKQSQRDQQHQQSLKQEYEGLRTLGRQYEDNTYKLTHSAEAYNRFRIDRAAHPDVTPPVVTQDDVDRMRKFADAMERNSEGLAKQQERMKAAYEALRQLARGYEDAAFQATHSAEAFEQYKIRRATEHPITPETVRQSDVTGMNLRAVIEARHAAEAQAREAALKAVNDAMAAGQMSDLTAQNAFAMGGGYPSLADKVQRDNEKMLRDLTRGIEAQRLHLDMNKYEAATPFEQMAMVRRAQEDATRYVTIWKEALKNVQDDFAHLFENVLTGQEKTWRNLGIDISKALSQMAAQIAAAMILNKVGHLLSHVGWLYSLFHPAGALDLSTATPNDIADASVSHGGGVMGADSFAHRSVSSAVFRGAPRLHRGLASDEYPAILQRGEAVLTPGQLRAVAAGGGAGQTVIVQMEHHWNIQAIDGASFNDRLVAHQATISGIMVDSIARSRRLAQMLQRPR